MTDRSLSAINRNITEAEEPEPISADELWPIEDTEEPSVDGIFKPENPILDTLAYLLDTESGKALLYRLVVAVEEYKLDRLQAIEERARQRFIAASEQMVADSYKATHDRMAERILTQPSKAERVAADMEALRAETEAELKARAWQFEFENEPDPVKRKAMKASKPS
jgi:hypothetical protein